MAPTSTPIFPEGAHRGQTVGVFGEHLARIFHELPAATTDMAVLPGVLECRPLRRTVRYASEPTPCGCQVARPSS
ncbi:MAG: hypothetical protein WBG51_00865, partial [Syntrophobacteria bacterium]